MTVTTEWDYLSDELQQEIIKYQQRIAELEQQLETIRSLTCNWTNSDEGYSTTCGADIITNESASGGYCHNCGRRIVEQKAEDARLAEMDKNMRRYGEPVMTLTCKCGDTITGSNDELFLAGWRFIRVKKDVVYLCPGCLQLRRRSKKG